MVDLETQTCLKDIELYCGGNTNDHVKLKEIIAIPSEWSERLKRNIGRVLVDRPLTALDYEKHVDFDAEMYTYLQRLYDFLFDDGTFPDTD